MTFVFHKSKQALTRATLKKDKFVRRLGYALTTDFGLLLIKQNSRMVNDNGHESVDL